jgi:hypothetical protein
MESWSDGVLGGGGGRGYATESGALRKLLRVAGHCELAVAESLAKRHLFCLDCRKLLFESLHGALQTFDLQWLIRKPGENSREPCRKQNGLIWFNLL